jgi:hypothetical protein
LPSTQIASRPLNAQNVRGINKAYQVRQLLRDVLARLVTSFMPRQSPCKQFNRMNSQLAAE